MRDEDRSFLAANVINGGDNALLIVMNSLHLENVLLRHAIEPALAVIKPRINNAASFCICRINHWPRSIVTQRSHMKVASSHSVCRTFVERQSKVKRHSEKLPRVAEHDTRTVNRNSDR